VRRHLLVVSFVLFCITAWCQVTNLSASSGGTPPDPRPTVSLQDALQRAKANNPQFRAAMTDAALAREDRVQARAAMLPGVSYTTGAIYTQPAFDSVQRFIAANGVREYISQGVVSENIGYSSVADYRRSHAAEALAKARSEIAARGLVVSVVASYYGAIVAQRRVENAEQAAKEAQRFVTISEELEKGGEVSHADVIRAQLQANDRQRDVQEAKLAEQQARLGLAVLIFPVFTQDFNLVDDLRFAVPLPQFGEVQQLAARNNPELKAAIAATQVANNEVQSAIGGHLPTLSVDYFYGIDAARYATRTDGFRNLGYQLSATLYLPIFTWGATRSRIRQAQLRQTQAQVELSAAQRQALADLQLFYSEATNAKNQIDVLRQSADLAAESLRLTNLRYRAGEASALEVVDAQNELTLARNNYDDGEVRYRVALANLQTLTGAF
jgi:outer membrane protein TolC